MADPKPFASLTSGLLARKGGARPAMRPQTIDKIGSGGWEDLGWNDMGDIPVEPDLNGHRSPSSITGLTPSPMPNGQVPPVVEQQRAIEESFAPETEEPEDEVFADEPAFEEPAFENDEAYDEGEAAILGAYEPETFEEEPAFAEEAEESERPVAEVVELPIHRADIVHAGSKAAFTLRLDEERHLKLRLACAVQNRSAQRIVCGALDAYLDSLPELDSLAQQVPPRRGKRL